MKMGQEVRPELVEVGAAAPVLRTILAGGPRRTCEVRALASEMGVNPDVLRKAVHRLECVLIVDVHRCWWWALPGHDLDDDLTAWLDTNEGKFAAYLAGRDRLLATTMPGEQLRIDVGGENER